MKDSVKITFTGDIMCSPGVAEACKTNGSYDFSKLLEHVREELNNTDYLVGNLETPIAGEELLYTHDRYCFNTPIEFAAEIKRMGVDLACLANNHCMDRDIAGICKTLDNLDSIGLEHIGVYRNKTERDKLFLKNINGLKVAFINYTYGTNAFYHKIFLPDDQCGMVNLFQPQETLAGSIDLQESAQDIKKKVDQLYGGANDTYEIYIKPHLDILKQDILIAKQSADFVIVVMHSGGQYNELPDAYTRMLTQIIRDFGADIIIGHHPHIIHPCEINQGYVTVFSLGNLIFEPSESPKEPIDPAYSILLHVYLKRKDKQARVDKLGFNLLKVIDKENCSSYTINTYNLLKQCHSDEEYERTLRYANLFANQHIFSEPQYEYSLEL